MRFVFAGVAAVAGAVSAVALTGGPDPTLARLDGCGTDRLAIIGHDEPNWAYILDRDSPATAPPPLPRWAEGIVQAGQGPLGAHPTPVDDPFTHDSYDFIVNLKPDPAYASLLAGEETEASGNYSTEDEERGRLHMEREQFGFPAALWPENGDRVVALGSWVWDCEHRTGGGSKAEFHPLRALWVERRFSPRSRSGEAEAALWYSNAKTPAGVEADCAHRTKGDKVKFKACLSPGGACTPNVFPCESRVFRDGFRRTFILHAPPRPSPRARLRARIVDLGSAPAAPRLFSRVRRQRLTVTLTVPPASSPLWGRYQLFLGWTPSPKPRHFRVELLELRVRRAMDPSCPSTQPTCPYRAETTQLGQIATAPGEWNLYADVGGIWSQLAPAVMRVRDGERRRLRYRVDLYVPRGRAWRLLVFPRECDFGYPTFDDVNKSVRPCPHTREFGHPTGDDKPGYVVAPGTVGLHRTNARLAGSTCPPLNKRGCWQLIWRATELR